MKKFFKQLRRIQASAVATVLIFVSIVAAVPMVSASASQVTARSVTMSSSTPSAASTSYTVSFTTATTGVIQGVVVDFCAGSPILGDGTGCSAPTGFTMTSAPTVTQTGLTGTSANWTAASSTPYNTLKYTYSSGASITAGTVITLVISTITNPSTVGTFYARVATYAASATATAYTSSTPGAYVDYGGMALSTAAVIQISAKVAESLTFCVYAATCGDTPSINLGHGTNVILDSTAVDTANILFSISTNAQYGVTVSMKGTVLTSGASSIPAVGAGAYSASTTIVAGTAAFGMRISSLGSTTAAAPYNGAAGSYGFDTTSASNTSSPYGSQIATISAPVNASVTTLTFGATASATTPAGNYTATEQLIATGKF